MALNKVDLADPERTQKWKKWYQEQGYGVVELDSLKGKGLNTIAPTAEEICHEKRERDQKRGLKNSFYNVFLVMGNNGSISFSNVDSNSNRYKYGGGADYTIVGEGSIQLTYSTVTGQFTTSSNGTPLQFFEQVNVTGGEDIIIGPSPVLVQDVLNNTEIPLTTIYRNQHIQLNIIFR